MNKTLADKRANRATEERLIDRNAWLIAPGVWRLKDLFVNVYIIQDESQLGWVLVDTGLESTAEKLGKLVGSLFGKGSLPKAIIMTHGHFDHRGSLVKLATDWGVPVYCHHMERPYLSGEESYPPADPSVGGGLMSLLSFTYPKSPINAGAFLRELPEDGQIDELKDWRWIHTPGHTPGHISLFREMDGVLIAGDAVVTTMQESLLAVATQKTFLCGPPKYFTPDWGAAARSVRELAALEPNVLATGHGHAMYGEEARKELHKLSRNFWQRGMPATGRYVSEPAQFDEDGRVTHIPKPKGHMIKKIAVGVALFALGVLISRQRSRSKSFVQRQLIGKLGGALKTSGLGALGATAAASPALPNIPVIPAL